MGRKSRKQKHSLDEVKILNLVVNTKRKGISSPEKSDIFLINDLTRSTHSSDAEETNKQKVSDRLSEVNIKKRSSISSNLKSNIDILEDITKSTCGSDEPIKQEIKIENKDRKYESKKYYNSKKEIISEKRADYYDINKEIISEIRADYYDMI